METRQLKYFLDVADCLNFTKAAQQNHIAQTAMSQNIISLENQLGVKLFTRNNRNVSLTSIGEIFYQEAQNIVNTAERAELRLERIAAGSEGIVRIGFQGEHESRFLPKLVREFRRLYPNVSLELQQGISGELEKMLSDNKVDVVFNIQYQSAISDSQELLVESQPLCVFVPTDHPFAGRTTISRSELAEEPMVFLDPACSESIFHHMLHDSIESGFTPKIVRYTTNIYTLILMVECGIGITVLPKSCWHHQDVACVPLEEESALNIVARWKHHRDNPSAQLFIDLLQNTYPHNTESQK